MEGARGDVDQCVCASAHAYASQTGHIDDESLGTTMAMETSTGHDSGRQRLSGAMEAGAMNEPTAGAGRGSTWQLSKAFRLMSNDPRRRGVEDG